MTMVLLTIIGLVVLPLPVWWLLRRQDARLTEVRNETTKLVQLSVEQGWTPSSLDIHTLISAAARERHLVLLPSVDEVLEDVARNLLLAHAKHIEDVALDFFLRTRDISRKEPQTYRLPTQSS